MSDNKITRANVAISFGTSSGFSSKVGYKGKNSDAILDAAKELAFLLNVEGRIDELTDYAQQLRGGGDDTET